MWKVLWKSADSFSYSTPKRWLLDMLTKLQNIPSFRLNEQQKSSFLQFWSPRTKQNLYWCIYSYWARQGLSLQRIFINIRSLPVLAAILIFFLLSIFDRKRCHRKLKFTEWKGIDMLIIFTDFQVEEAKTLTVIDWPLNKK